jgi:flagellar motor switch protein FliM
VSEILSQAEIEALLSSMSSDDVTPAAPVAAPAAPTGSAVPPNLVRTQTSRHGTSRGGSPIAYEVYDFRRPDKFSKDQLRTLQMLHETFARMSASSLSAYLRAPVTIDLISLEQVPYEEYLRSITNSVFTIMSLPPLTGQAVLEIEFSLVFTMIDRMLGGPGRAINRTSLTEIERPLVRQTLERIFGSLKTAWEGVVIVNPGIEGMETSAQFVQIAPPNDIVVTILFEVKIGNQRGAMSLCIPYLVLKPITTKLSAQKWFASNNRKHNPLAKRLLSNQIQSTNVECAVELGKCRLAVKDFLELQPGDVLRLERATDDPLVMKVAGVPKYEGRPALDGKNLAFTISSSLED